MHASRWRARAPRARDLAARHSTQAEIRSLYGELADYQGSRLQSPVTNLELQPVVASLPGLLAWLARTAPARLADAAREVREIDPVGWYALLERYWTTEGHDLPDVDEATLFVIEASLGPFAESAATQRGLGINETTAGSRRCPICTGKPLVGALREEGQGARRSLVCGLCLTEWVWPRVVCPACGEDRFEVLSVYSSDSFPSARVDACDTCRTYLKTIDLTKDGHALPVVDELACMPLDLWAHEQRYTKLRRNLLRM